MVLSSEDGVFKATCFGLVSARTHVVVLPCSNAVLTGLNRPHTMRTWMKVGVGEDSERGRMRARGNCTFPSTSLTRLGRVAPTFPSRRLTRPLVLPPAFAGAKPRRPTTYFLGQPFFIGRQRNCSSSMPFRHRLPRGAQANVLPAQRGDPAPNAMRPLGRSHLLPMSARARPAAGFRPASPGPVACNSSLLSVLPRSTVPSCTQLLLPTMAAAGRRAVRPLVRRGALLWRHQARRSPKPY